MRALSLALLALALGCASPPPADQEPMVWVPDQPRAPFDQAQATCDAHFPLLGAMGASSHQLAVLIIQRRRCMNGYGWYLVPESQAWPAELMPQNP